MLLWLGKSPPTKSLQADKGKLTCPLRLQRSRQLPFVAELVRWTAQLRLTAIDPIADHTYSTFHRPVGIVQVQ